MGKTSGVAMSQLRALLTELGFREYRAPNALVFKHPKEGLVVFRLYQPDDPVREGDVRSTRMFLDYRGLLEASDFDERLCPASKPA
jgi:hypothetical protein